MPKIAISYRRDDSEAITGRIFDRFVAHYGNDSVFRDIDSIPLGSDFREQIEKALENTGALIVVIGAKWRGQGKSGHVRIQDEADPVRIELEIALRKNIPVVPVLIGSAKMPAAAQLPESLRSVVFRHACRVDPGQDFEHHADRLLREMDRLLGLDGAAETGAARPARSTGVLGRPSMPPRTKSDTVVEAEVAAATAPVDWGGYTRASVSHYIGSYLVIRPTFKTPGSIYAYATDLEWDAEEGGLIFQERNRPDAHYTQRGRVWIPRSSIHLYLVTAKDGWLRGMTLSFLDLANEMHGIVSTLHNVSGAMYVPVAAPIVFIKRETFDQDRFGELTPGSEHHARYIERLRRTISEQYAQIVIP